LEDGAGTLQQRSTMIMMRGAQKKARPDGQKHQHTSLSSSARMENNQKTKDKAAA
jgi:hypothetical protein